mgnify:CR=1 FL=1
MKNKNLIILLIGLILSFLSLILDKNIKYILDPIKNSAFDLIFGWFASFINVFVILILVTTLFLFEEKKREWVFPLWLSFIFSIVISFVLKLIIARPRPSIEIFYPLINTLDFSFPSMHAMVAFSAIPILNKEFAELKWFWILFALLVAFSRVYLDVHFLSDVVFGAFTGYFIGVFVVYVEKKYKPFKFLKS